MQRVLMVPTMFPEAFKPNFPENLNPEDAKKTLDMLLANGYKVKIMNDFVYEQVVFTHYVLEE